MRNICVKLCTCVRSEKGAFCLCKIPAGSCLYMCVSPGGIQAFASIAIKMHFMQARKVLKSLQPIFFHAAFVPVKKISV